MTAEAALANLRADAMFYQLDGLVHAIDEIDIPHVAMMKADERYLAFLGVNTCYAHPLNLVNIVHDVKNWIVMPVAPDGQLKPPFHELDLPESATTFDELLVLSAVQGVLKDNLGKRYRNHWKLVGYKMESPTRSAHKTIILVERSM
ncbi:hypothetical protein RSOL_008870, partial [Rhizoctonia solani AG-3 Rhs1AP]